jgi:hypothetical protein
MGGTSLPLELVRVLHTAGTVTIPAARLWASLTFWSEQEKPRTLRCLLDTGAPVSVIPQNIWQAHQLAWHPLSGPWPQGLLTWLGVPCLIGRTDIWLAIPEWPFLRGPFPFIAKFAQALPSGLMGPPPVLLGLNFLADQGADTNFQCHTPPSAGAITLP